MLLNWDVVWFQQKFLYAPSNVGTSNETIAAEIGYLLGENEQCVNVYFTAVIRISI